MVIDRRSDGKIVLQSQVVVVRAVTGRDMHESGTAVHRHEIGRQQNGVTIEKRMARLDVVELRSSKCGERLPGELEVCVRQKLWNQFLGEQQGLRCTVA